MLILFETANGYALFKVLDESKLSEPNNIFKEFKDSQSRANIIQLHKFKKFENLEEAAEAVECIQESNTLHKSLAAFIKKEIVKRMPNESLAVLDPKLGGLLKDKFQQLKIVHDSAVMELQRGLRQYVVELLNQLSHTETESMKVGLSHELCRHKLQFSAEKVDTMIVQAIGLLDELDKEVNIYAMRVKEWYGWHFPEMVKILPDNMSYCRVVMEAGYRKNIPTTDLSSILEETVETDLKNMAKLSMGSQITDEDLKNIRYLAQQVLDLSDYRKQLDEYLRNRMMAIAPTLTMMVGELVGARLLAHAGSLVNLAKYPASTVQILGAEKALFRALKQSTDTPKYGLIYHASFVTAASTSNKARIARTLACKTALATRMDAFTTVARTGERESKQEGEIDEKEWQNQTQLHAGTFLGQLQSRIDKLEGRKVAVKSKTMAGAVLGKHEFSGSYEKYDESHDVAMKEEKFDITPVSTKQTGKKRKRSDAEAGTGKTEDTMEPPAKRARKDEQPSTENVPAEASTEKKKKKKKKGKDEPETPTEPKQEPKVEETSATTSEAQSVKKEKKKKKKKKAE